LDSFLGAEGDDPFFVKNLERVQGDERDSIILTLGYGKNPDTGEMGYSFGPINNEGGERRLNVAITRARKRLALVSSFSARDLDEETVKKAKNRGPKVLRDYLTYAEAGGNDLGQAVRDRPSLNPFEIQVRDALESEGLSLTPQLGVSGYLIDFAVTHPDDPARFVLAIECDGASYHSSPTARDRDRLRQEHLERLGWRFSRIWSTTWFNDRDRALAKVLADYHEAIAEDDLAVPEGGVAAEGPLLPPQLRGRPERRKARPAMINRYDFASVRRMVVWVKSDTLLRTDEELFWDTLRALGFQRAGKKIAHIVKAAIADVARGNPA
jgi:very-short-patch-repair endonuclease